MAAKIQITHRPFGSGSRGSPYAIPLFVASRRLQVNAYTYMFVVLGRSSFILS